MDVNEAISQLQALATAHPYIALALILFLIGALVRGRAAIILYVLGGLALLKGFGLVDAFVSFLKDIPSLIQDALGGV